MIKVFNLDYFIGCSIFDLSKDQNSKSVEASFFGRAARRKVYNFSGGRSLRVGFTNQLEHLACLLAAHEQGLGAIKVGDLVPLGFNRFC